MFKKYMISKRKNHPLLNDDKIFEAANKHQIYPAIILNASMDWEWNIEPTCDVSHKSGSRTNFYNIGYYTKEHIQLRLMSSLGSLIFCYEWGILQGFELPLK